MQDGQSNACPSGVMLKQDGHAALYHPTMAAGPVRNAPTGQGCRPTSSILRMGLVKTISMTCKTR